MDFEDLSACHSMEDQEVASLLKSRVDQASAYVNSVWSKFEEAVALAAALDLAASDAAQSSAYESRGFFGGPFADYSRGC